MMLRSLELYTHHGTLPEPLCASSVRMCRVVALYHAYNPRYNGPEEDFGLQPARPITQHTL